MFIAVWCRQLSYIHTQWLIKSHLSKAACSIKCLLLIGLHKETNQRPDNASDIQCHHNKEGGNKRIFTWLISCDHVSIFFNNLFEVMSLPLA